MKLIFNILTMFVLILSGRIFCQEEQLVRMPDFLAKKIITTKTPGQKLEIKDKIKDVVFVCPNLTTGGPENLAQIYHVLKKLGFEVDFFWVTGLFDIKKKYQDGIWYLCKDEKNTVNSLYLDLYGVTSLNHDVPLVPSTLVIVPEIWTDLMFFFEPAIPAIAWLSISNFGADCSRNLRAWSCVNSLASVACLHLNQSPWGQKILTSLGVNSLLIGDYISDLYLKTESVACKLDNTVAFFPHKGGQLAEQFAVKYQNFSYIRLQNLDKWGVLQALDSAKIYIDFGHFPGRDRVPREAVARNCIIFIHNIGCATDYDSFPIDDYFRFSDQDVVSGVLFAKVCEALFDYEDMKHKQDFMRQQIFDEPLEFTKNIINFFGNPAQT